MGAFDGRVPTNPPTVASSSSIDWPTEPLSDHQNLTVTELDIAKSGVAPTASDALPGFTVGSHTWPA